MFPPCPKPTFSTNVFFSVGYYLEGGYATVFTQRRQKKLEGKGREGTSEREHPFREGIQPCGRLTSPIPISNFNVPVYSFAVLSFQQRLQLSLLFSCSDKRARAFYISSLFFPFFFLFSFFFTRPLGRCRHVRPAVWSTRRRKRNLPYHKPLSLPLGLVPTHEETNGAILWRL